MTKIACAWGLEMDQYHFVGEVVLRADYSDQGRWDEVRQAIYAATTSDRAGFEMIVGFSQDDQADSPDFESFIQMIDAPEHAESLRRQFMEPQRDDESPYLVFIADRQTIMHPDMPILVIDRRSDPIRLFRTVPSQVYMIQSNLSIMNMGWEDIANLVDEEGVFRGFGAY